MMQKARTEEQAIPTCSGPPAEAGQEDEILVTWQQREEIDDARVGAMYCFKNCDKNKN